MPTALTKSAEDALALFRHHDALAIANRTKANAALGQFLDIISYDDAGATVRLDRAPKCVRVWTRWLAENGPNTRAYITEATDTKFSERGTPHTIRWDDITGDTADDDLFPASTIIRFKGNKLDAGRGAPPTIFALWSQRYDVLPKFGVGPERPGCPECQRPAGEGTGHYGTGPCSRHDLSGLPQGQYLLSIPADVGPMLAEHGERLEADLIAAMQEPVEPDLGQKYFETVTRPVELNEDDEASIAALMNRAARDTIAAAQRAEEAMEHDSECPNQAEDHDGYCADQMAPLTGVIRPVPEYDWEGAEDWPQQTIDAELDQSEERTPE